MKKPTLPKPKSIKKKHVVIVVMVVVACLASLYLYLNQPSDEMRQLRKVETELSLPEHTKRSEDDRGVYEDKNQAQHSSRSITLNFNSSDKIEPVIEKLKNNKDWENTMSFASDAKREFEFISNNKKSCLSVSFDSTDPNKQTHILIIKAPSDDGCKAFFS